jgi:dihydroorotase
MTAPQSLLIRGGRLIDPLHGTDKVGDLYIVDGRIVADPLLLVDRVIEARGMIVCPGFVDCRVSLGEPGFEEDETIASGTAAALAGGYTLIASLPDTNPVVETRADAEFVSQQAARAGNCRVVPLGAVTKGREGKELAEIGELIAGGAVAFTDAKQPIMNSEVMRRALEYTRMWDAVIMHHPQVPELVQGGVMHEGYHSSVLGLRGMPTAAEEIMVRRDIALTELTGGRIHLMAITSRRSVEEIRDARQRGVRVSADVTPHHLLLTDKELVTYDPNYKVDPPLRTTAHIDALIEALKEGVIETISSDHTPLASEKKAREIDQVPFGIASIETVLPLCVEALIAPGHLTWLQLIQKLTIGPAKLLKQEATKTLAPGTIADLTVIDPQATYQIDLNRSRSLGRNSPFHGRPATGQVQVTIEGGVVKYEC